MQPVELPTAVLGMLVPNNGNGVQYNLPLITALVVHLGSLGYPQLQSSTPLIKTPVATFFKALLCQFEPEGRFYLLNAMANQLRYPNSHTHFFHALILALFADSDDELVLEQMTRVLLERLIVHRPHPWGLLVTFIELIKNPIYQFWTHPFTRCAPEMERVFDSVARSCRVPASALRPEGAGRGTSAGTSAPGSATSATSSDGGTAN
jgi:CCR4-NOT transcription complex subunit 1